MAVEQALVLGGGGVAGIAWMTGMLAGLADAGQDVTTDTDLVIGTSAGVTVAAQLGGGLSLAGLFARQVDPALQSREIVAKVDWAKFAADLQPYLEAARTPAERRRTFGEFALNAQTVSESKRLAVIESRLTSPAWPATATRLIAVDCVSGEPAVLMPVPGFAWPMRWPRAARCLASGHR